MTLEEVTAPLAAATGWQKAYLDVMIEYKEQGAERAWCSPRPAAASWIRRVYRKGLRPVLAEGAAAIDRLFASPSAHQVAGEVAAEWPGLGRRRGSLPSPAAGDNLRDGGVPDASDARKQP